MLAPWGDIETCLDTMKARQIIPTDVTASALAHLLLLALVFLFSEVHPFGAVTAEPIAVDIVAPQDLQKQDLPNQDLPNQDLPHFYFNQTATTEKKPEPVPPQLALDKPAAASAAAPAAQLQAPARPQKQAALAASRAPPPQATTPVPAYK